MLRKSGESTSAAVFVDPSGRRRRAFRTALVAVTLGWVGVIVLVVVGLTSAPDAPRTVLAGPPSHRPTASATLKTSLNAHQKSSIRLSENTKVFTRVPPACSSERKCASRGCRISPTAATAIAFDSVQAAFNGYGVAPPSDTAAGNFDCRGFSFQAPQLAADGFEPGDKVAVGGQTLTLPQVSAGTPDEIVAEGQVIRLTPARGPVSELGILGAGEFGTQRGTVTVTYVGGSKQTATLRLADWYADTPAPGGLIAAVALWNVPPASVLTYKPAPVSVYYAQIPVDPAKKISSVTLPRNADMHLFDIGVPTAARYSSVSSAYNDTALAPAVVASDGNYDGMGHSYDSDALAAMGLAPGASVTAHGVKFTWPHYGAGHFDNIRAEGQTIRVSGAGRVLGFLGAAAMGTQRGQITIHYTDGSSQSATLSFADWRATRAVAGGTVVATVPWNLVSGTTSHQVSVYSATVPLESGKTVASVTLPVNFDLHLFAIAAGA